MKGKMRLGALLLAGAMLVGLASCSTEQGTGASAQPSASEVASAVPTGEGQPRTVTDAAGREVVIPEKVERVAITCNGGAHQEVTILGASDRIVAMPSTSKFNQLEVMFPAYADVLDAGGFDDVNVEEMIKADPDIIFVGLGSDEGNAKLEEAGFTTYTMYVGYTDIERLKQEFLNVGAILGNEETAQELVDYWEEKVAMVADAVAQVPEEARKTVYYTGNEITAANASDWTWAMIEGAGGISALPRDSQGDVNVEDVLSWDPDVILVEKGGSTEEILSDERIQDMAAITQGAVYKCPTGAFWWDRPSPESPLFLMWLAKTLYPEYTQEIDLKAETKAFFQQFYQYDLSDEEYESFFA